MKKDELVDSQQLIKQECDKVKDLLLQKNADYGNSFADPVHIFSTLDPEQALNLRIDDKLARIKNGSNVGIPEDTELDLIGYLILKRVLRRIHADAEDDCPM